MSRKQCIYTDKMCRDKLSLSHVMCASATAYLRFSTRALIVNKRRIFENTITYYLVTDGNNRRWRDVRIVKIKRHDFFFFFFSCKCIYNGRGNAKDELRFSVTFFALRRRRRIYAYFFYYSGCIIAAVIIT